jgi:hypothetical protein
MNMKKTVIFLFLISSFIGFSQEDAWVYFKDKPDYDSFISNPLSELSQRALDRRLTQNISLDLNDAPINQLYINQISSATGITVMAKSKWLNCVHVRGSQTDINALKLFNSVLRVDFANKSLNIVSKKIYSDKIKPVNKVLANQVDFNYGTSANQIEMLNGHLLHQQNYTGSGKIIAVLDAGFPGVDNAQPFQRLRDNSQILGGYNYVTRNSNFYSGDSHGTLVLSLMGGYNEGQLVGTAPDAAYYLYITEDNDSENPIEESNWVEAAEAADRVGADIITTSLGYFAFDNPYYSYNYADMTGNFAFASKGANIAFNRGIIVVASAGNEGGTSEKHVGVPAEALNVIAVGAVKYDRTYATFSSIGPSADGRVKPDVMAQGEKPYYSDTLGNIVNNYSGTSFSCPIMAGMIACLWQAYPNNTNQEIKQLVTQSADKYSMPTVQYGYGIPNFSLALANGLSVNSFSKSDFLVYPNPTSDAVSVSLPEGIDFGNTIIYSVLGQKVLEKTTTKQDPFISLKFLNKGTYLYKIESRGFSKSGKIIKQ